jgi:hypothetical protein
MLKEAMIFEGILGSEGAGAVPPEGLSRPAERL